MLPNPLSLPQRLLAANVQSLFERDRFPQEQYRDPPGDPGLFGPESVTWYVHGDASMIVGGVAALMLQALHPLAMAGVAEHSNFKEDPLGRLSRTSSFVTATTYGSTEVAESLIAAVREVHTRVHGVAPDGRPYSAEDPALLRWVHVAEVASFLRAHRRYHPRPVRGDDLDRYFDETAVVAERLGAPDVPRSRAEVSEYLRAVRSELVAGDQALDTMRFLQRPFGPNPLVKAGSQVVVQAAQDLLPPWARELYGLRRLPLLDAAALRPATFAAFTALRAVLGPPPVPAEARARCTAA